MSVVVAVLVALAVASWPGRSKRLRSLAARGAASAGGVPPTSVATLASTADLLSMALRSGCGVIEALEAVGERQPDAAGAHLRSVASALRWGVPDDEAWHSVPDAWAPVARALTLANRAGVPPADLIARAADDLRAAERARLEMATAQLGVRVVLPLGLAFLPAFVLTTVVPVVVALLGDVLA
ncbi:MAG: type II secretion system F family protein [Dermatophilus congolensis]|nr:type II secretion system F family protein [Dermatophilus congolensis]